MRARLLHRESAMTGNEAYEGNIVAGRCVMITVLRSAREVMTKKGARKEMEAGIVFIKRS